MVKVEGGIFSQTIPSSSRVPIDAEAELEGTVILNAIQHDTLDDVESSPKTVKVENFVKVESIFELELPLKIEHAFKAEESIELTSVPQRPTPKVPQSPHISPTPPPESACDDLSTNDTISKASTPPLKQPKKLTAISSQFIGDLPVARQEALASFTEIHDNNYQYKTLGRSRELLESMTCDCTYEHG